MHAEVFRGFLWSSEIFRDFQRLRSFSEIIRCFEAVRKKPPGGFVVSNLAMIWRNVLANFVGVLAQSGAVVGSFTMRISDKVFATSVPQTHHVTSLRCGCSYIDMEDVELWVCWICLPKVFSYSRATL